LQDIKSDLFEQSAAMPFDHQTNATTVKDNRMSQSPRLKTNKDFPLRELLRIRKMNVPERKIKTGAQK
jgi:hypothetical protein